MVLGNYVGRAKAVELFLYVLVMSIGLVFILLPDHIHFVNLPPVDWLDVQQSVFWGVPMFGIGFVLTCGWVMRNR